MPRLTGSGSLILSFTLLMLVTPLRAQNIAGEYEARITGTNHFLDRSPAQQAVSATTSIKVTQSGDQITMEVGGFAGVSAATIFKGKVGNNRFSAVWWYQGSDHETKVVWGTVSGNRLQGRLIYPRVADRSGLVPGWVEVTFSAEKAAALTEDCLAFNPNRVQVQRRGSRWILMDGASSMKAFDVQNEAMRAREIIRFYDLNQHCFVGRPDPSLEYWLVKASAPSGALSNEDCIGFNAANLRLSQEGGRWLMADGNNRLYMFPNRQEAEQALAVIRKYGFSRTCYVGRPDPSMTYFR